MVLVIKNAKIVFPDRVFEGGVVVENGRIADVLSNGRLPSADEIIDAKGMYLLPGLVDVHTHFSEPGASSGEDWKTGSAAAAAGGVTTVLSMPGTQPPATTVALLEEKRANAASQSMVDYGFHFAASVDNSEEIRKVEHVASVKFQMASTAGCFPVHGDNICAEEMKVRNDYVLFEAFKILAEKKLLATVHAESNGMIDYLKDKQIKAQRNDPSAYAESRPPLCAAEAAGRVALLARIAGARLHLCHVSSAREVEVLTRNKNSQALSSEAALHHLFLSAKDLKERGSILKTVPPLRSPEDREALWKGVQNGVVDVITSDHMPYLPESKEGSVWTAAAGLPGIETMLPLLLNEVNKKNLSINTLVCATAENPARIFEIKNKGRIEAGYDADLVLVDLDREHVIRNDSLYTNCGWSPYDGLKINGAVVMTMLRGAIIYDNPKPGDAQICRVKGLEVEYE
ncbi:MAG: dihydroorotase family protein [Candidatus Altiarchaeia archaeon]